MGDELLPECPEVEMEDRPGWGRERFGGQDWVGVGGTAVPASLPSLFPHHPSQAHKELWGQCGACCLVGEEDVEKLLK